MRRSVYFSSLAALLAGTAIAGPQGAPPPARPPCCAAHPAAPAGTHATAPAVAPTVAGARAGIVAAPTPAATPGRTHRSAARAAAAPAVADAAHASGDPDAAELDALIDTLYATVSGPAGARRDWARLAGLHAPGARLHVTRAGAGGALDVDSLDFDAFIALHEARFADRGFHEREIAREVAGFGRVRHVWSTFEARRHPDDPSPYARGVNSLQLVRTPAGWRLVSATWDFETPDRRLPARVAAFAAEGGR